MKRILIIALALTLVFALAACSGGGGGGDNGTPDGGTAAPAAPGDDDPCPCCPDCVQAECVCEECGGNDDYDCKCSAPGGDGFGTISFDMAAASSPNRNLPSYFVENYTLDFTATRVGSGTTFGNFTGTGYMVNEMDTSGAVEASGGKILIDEMGWEGPLSNTSFELVKPEEVALTADEEEALALLATALAVSNSSSISWSVTGEHFLVGTDGGGTAPMAETYELTYYIVVYKNGKAELYLFGTTASDVLCFQGTVK